MFQINPFKKEKMSSILERMAAEFIVREGAFTSLVTVTGSRLNDSKRHMDILVSVLPETDEKNVIDFLSKHKGDFSEYVDKHAKIGRMPACDFKIDKGEKNRQIVEDII